MSEAIPGMQEAPPPAEPKDAAVVVLVRMGPRGLETFWLRRDRTVSFAAGFYAFPGGRVDASDAEIPIEGAGPPDSRLVAAAARELFEETGVLAARGRTPDLNTLAEARQAVLEGRETFSAVLTRLGLQVDALDFEPAGRWVTPPFMPVRFDARFFLVEVPPGTRAEVWPGEAAEGSWVRPTDALTLWQEGRALLHPPNRHALNVLSRVRRTIDAVAWLASPTAADTRIEFQRGVRLVALRTPTLLPATHTNAWILGTGELLIVDPGASDPTEIERLTGHVRSLAAEDCRPLAVVLTHHHLDHMGGAAAVSEQLGIPVWCHARTADRLPFRPDRLLQDGDELTLAGAPAMRWQVLHTPGHARGHLTLIDAATRAAVVGDMVAGQGTILIDPPEGEMAEYLRQLGRLRDVPVRAVYPAHGPPLPDGPTALAAVLEHRAMRERRVHAALSTVSRTLDEVASDAYADTPGVLPYLAERSTLAILEKLRDDGVARESGGGWALV
jgi:glyoxylase-like metal-dependent hydrolase (beta-lactamase superfamily II)/8-oxo-dGTP pyrophosphatase MutT (NUDIX family)